MEGRNQQVHQYEDKPRLYLQEHTRRKKKAVQKKYFKKYFKEMQVTMMRHWILGCVPHDCGVVTPQEILPLSLFRECLKGNPAVETV